MRQGKYSKDFKLQAVKRVLEDSKSQKQVASELGMSNRHLESMDQDV